MQDLKNPGNGGMRVVGEFSGIGVAEYEEQGQGREKSRKKNEAIVNSRIVWVFVKKLSGLVL